MKELSVEQKAKAYDEGILKLRGMMPNWERLSYNGKTFLQDLVYIFPELKESEDEKIRKAIVKMISDIDGGSQFEKYGIIKKEALAWLEKQGEKGTNGNEREIPISEQNLTGKVEPKFKVGNKIKLAKEPKYPAREIIAIRNDAYYFDESVYLPFSRQDEWELVEQKPTGWSEEDEENLNWFEKFFRAESVIAEGKDIPQDRYLWFKNLKGRVQPQNTWSPSDGELECLGYAIEKAKKDWSPLTNNRIYLTLKALKEQLKKLREE